MESNSKKIVSEKDILLRGKIYKQITYDDTTSTLRRFDEKYKMWINLNFKQEGFDDSEIVKGLIDYVCEHL